ncbi:MAG TPA: hypothetical protein VID74_06600 [Gemmatimonadales bacterium]
MTRTLRIKLGLAGVIAAAACSPSDLLKVNNPDIINPTDVTTPGGVAALYAGAFGDFDVAYISDNGGEGGLAIVSGSFSDELVNSETFPTRIEYDHRGPIDLKNSSLLTLFRRVHRARRSAETAAAAIKAVDATPLTDPRIGEMYSLAGLIYTGMGEMYCNGMPVSDATLDGKLTFSDPLTTTQVYNRAVDRFDSALKYFGANANASLAKIGLARTLLDLNQPAAAAAAVAGIPTTYVYNLTFNLGVTAQNNPVYGFMNLNARFSVANKDGGNGINFRDALDPRVPWARVPATRLGFDKATPQFDQGHYFNESAPIPIATGVEARLIEAEAALAAGDATTWLNTLNALRANAALYPKTFPAVFPLPPTGSSFLPGFTQPPPLVDPVDPAARVDMMFRERAFWLYLTDHRMGDLRRLVTQYGRSAADVFPGGGGAQYVVDGVPKGGVFGNDVNLPIPSDELNNPKFTACIDRNP